MFRLGLRKLSVNWFVNPLQLLRFNTTLQMFSTKIKVKHKIIHHHKQKKVDREQKESQDEEELMQEMGDQEQTQVQVQHSEQQLNKESNVNRNRDAIFIESEKPLKVTDLALIPTSDKYLWAHKYFNKDTQIALPVFDFKTNRFSGENIVLSHSVFNVPIRKDLIQRVFLYNQEYRRRTFKYVLTKGLVAGSGKKPFQQKKTGRARQGNKRAPNLHKGGKAHGAKPREFYFPLNKRVRILALKSILTSKLIQNRIIIVNSEELETPNVFELAGVLKFLKRNPTLFITGNEADENFLKAKHNLVKYFHHYSAEKVNVMKVMKHKFIMFTVDGLLSLQNTLERRENEAKGVNRKNRYKPLEVDNPSEKYEFDFDPNKNLEIVTPVLKKVYKDILQLNEQGDNPDVGTNKPKTKYQLILERKKIRRARKLVEKKQREEENLKKELEKKKLDEEKKAKEATKAKEAAKAKEATKTKDTKEKKEKDNKKKEKEPKSSKTTAEATEPTKN